MGEQKSKSQSKSPFSFWHVFVVGTALFWGFVLKKAVKDPLTHLVPNFLLFTSFRTATDASWDWVLERNIDKSITYEPQPIPEMTAEEFSFEKMREATSNFRYPAVVRGMFANTTAIQNWHKPGYVSSRLGDFEVAVVQKAKPNKMDNYRETQFERFEDAFSDVMYNENTTKYLFFPLLSRFKTSKGEAQSYAQQMKSDLKDQVTQLMRDDLDLNRIWPGFAGPEHHKKRGTPGFMGSQFIAGRGKVNGTSGSNWHCAYGNNWFVQIHGTKHWQFMDQEYSSFMHPQRDGMGNVITGWKNAEEMQKYVPIKYCDLHAGDMLYNPDWEWHKIKNAPGLSIGCPLREQNNSLAFSNNFQFASMIAINQVLFHVFGIRYGLLQKG